MRKVEMKTAAVVLAALLAFSSAALSQEVSADAKAAQKAINGRIKGVAEAPVTVYEIADFQCPYCARFADEVFPRVDSAYIATGKVKWIFLNFPLPNHINSWAASEAAMCAAAAGGDFWAMHEKLYAGQNDWVSSANPGTTFTRYATEAHVPLAAYNACVANDKIAWIIVRDLLNAAGTGLTGTPAYIVNSDPLFTGYKPFEEWKAILDGAIKKATAPAK